jgi:hypothetical protein
VLNRPPTPMPMSQTHRLQLRGWQAVLVLGCHADRATAKMLLPELFHHLRVPHVPDVRDYQELLGCVLCARFEDLAVEPLLVPALQQFDAAVQVSASLLVITSYLFRGWAAAAKTGVVGTSPPHAATLIHAVAPYLCHNSAYVRGTAAWGFSEILDTIGPEGSAALAGTSADGVLIGDLHRFLSSNKECQKMRGRTKPVFLGFDPGPRTALACLTDRSAVLPRPGR